MLRLFYFFLIIINILIQTKVEFLMLFFQWLKLSLYKGIYERDILWAGILFFQYEIWNEARTTNSRVHDLAWAVGSHGYSRNRLISDITVLIYKSFAIFKEREKNRVIFWFRTIIWLFSENKNPSELRLDAVARWGKEVVLRC